MEKLLIILILIVIYVVFFSTIVAVAINSLGSVEYRERMRKKEKIIKLAINEANEVKRFEILNNFEKE